MSISVCDCVIVCDCVRLCMCVCVCVSPSLCSVCRGEEGIRVKVETIVTLRARVRISCVHARAYHYGGLEKERGERT